MQEQRIRRFRQTSVNTRVSVVKSKVERADTSRQIDQESAFLVTSLGGKVALIPPYSPRVLYNCTERNNMLRQCIAAMVTNVALCGFDIAQVDPSVPIDEDERAELQSFIDFANSEESLTTVHAKVVNAYEDYGYSYLEVIPDRKGRPTLLRHAQELTMRLCPKDDQNLQKVTYDVNRGPRTSTVTEMRAFRRFIQVVNGKIRFFKEFGDQRQLNMDTGEFGSVPEALQATSIIHFRQNSADAYGVPKWINQLPSIYGSREAEEFNLRYFEDNTVPPLMLTVAGGRLTAQSYRDLKALVENDKGSARDRQNRMILIEAVAEREGLDDKGTVTLKVDKLTDARQSDSLFREYDESNQAKIRSSFRLPPVCVGLSQDVTFATASVSAFIAESQVYLPQRNIFDEIYNKKLVNSEQGLNLKTCKLVSRVPLASSPDTIIKSMTALNVMGALTPRMANELGNQLLQVDLDPYPEKGAEGYEDWIDKPILFITKGTASDAGQAGKSQDVKDIENTGNIQKPPEHGQE